jgi:EpsD family peptidyl-prolyl cis-trans isomerase
MGMAGIVGCPTGLLCLATLVLSACGGGKASQQDAPVIASIDGHPLTLADLSDSSEASGEASGAQANMQQPTRAAVDSLIDEHLLAQQAMTEGLDQDPQVAQALQNARRRILADAFAARLRPPQSSPTAAEIEDYYRSNPALFSERRHYSLAIFTVGSAELSEELLETIEHTTSVQALGQLLRHHAIRFDLQRLERAADELPMSQIAQYAAATVGDVLLMPEANGSTQLIQIAAIRLRPNPFESARPAIERYLAQRDKAAALQAYLARARSQAHITYYVQEASPSRTRGTPAAPSYPTIAEGVPNRDAALAALN